MGIYTYIILHDHICKLLAHPLDESIELPDHGPAVCWRYNKIIGVCQTECTQSVCSNYRPNADGGKTTLLHQFIFWQRGNCMHNYNLLRKYVHRTKKRVLQLIQKFKISV